MRCKSHSHRFWNADFRHGSKI